ncbi:MAG: LacI family DNA-binding transcriptional regulator [Micrococcaceae bacterium]
MTNLNDVARHAHVSKMTVSRVINHPELVSDEVRVLVERSIKELNYIPNKAGIALATRQKFVIQFMILEDVEVAEPNYAILLLYLADVLQANGFSLEIVYQISDTSKVDAIIVSGWRESDLEMLSKMDIPVILYGEGHDDVALPYVDSDNRNGTYQATEHLIKTGYEKIIYIGIEIKLPFTKSRELGYCDAVVANKLPAIIYTADNHSHAAEAVVDNLLPKLEKDTAFVCSSDRIALGVMRAVAKEFKIPEEIGLIGFDGVFIDRITSPQLSTIRQPFPEIAEELANNTLNAIKRKNTENKLIVPELIIRNSCR